MAKYEIMLIVSGTLDEAQAKSVADDVAKPISDCKPQIEAYGLQELAYKIKNQSSAYRFQYNFDCESPAHILEFRRLCTINKNIIRSLIINLEKDYGYRASVNPKKVAANKKTGEINAQRKAELEKMRLDREATRGQDFDSPRGENKDFRSNDFRSRSRTTRTTDGAVKRAPFKSTTPKEKKE